MAPLCSLLLRFSARTSSWPYSTHRRDLRFTAWCSDGYGGPGPRNTTPGGWPLSIRLMTRPERPGPRRPQRLPHAAHADECERFRRAGRTHHFGKLRSTLMAGASRSVELITRRTRPGGRGTARTQPSASPIASRSSDSAAARTRWSCSRSEATVVGSQMLPGARAIAVLPGQTDRIAGAAAQRAAVRVLTTHWPEGYSN